MNHIAEPQYATSSEVQNPRHIRASVPNSEMNRHDCCILINSTPKYYEMAFLQITLLRRYAPLLKWRVFFATEVPEHPVCQRLANELDVELLVLGKDDTGFLESRVSSLALIPSGIKYILPLQDDFLLDRAPMYSMIEEACRIMDMDRSVASLRLMPCPGPVSSDPLYNKDKVWQVLVTKKNALFTYQATLWRFRDYSAFLSNIVSGIRRDFPDATTPEKKKQIALDLNYAEVFHGQNILWKQSEEQHLLHLAYPRIGKWSNAVYLCPFPYRPTAIVRGKIEPFALELAKREDISLSINTNANIYH